MSRPAGRAACTGRPGGRSAVAKLLTVFATECRGAPDCQVSQVVEGPVPFYALCEHHALPFYGRAYVGYIAHEHIIGISKLTRLVRLFAKRFTVQERIGQLIADALEAMLQPTCEPVLLAPGGGWRMAGPGHGQQEGAILDCRH